MCRIKWVAPLLCLNLTAHGADALPDYLTGTWGTAASLYEGTTAQADIYLLADGQGILAGSTPATIRIDGKDAGQPGPRAVIDIPVLAAMHDETLVLTPSMPDAQQTKKLAGTTIECSYQQQSAVLTCRPPRGDLLVLSRRSDTVPEHIVKQLKTLKR